MKVRQAPNTLIIFITMLVMIAPLLTATRSVSAAPPLPGAIFTAAAGCSGVNVNIFGSKDDVYLNGGPAHPSAAGLPDGSYYVRVTEPNGTLLGTSVGSGNSTPVMVVGGEFAACYQLSAILIRASDSNPGYDTTSNPGGEYKVWVSTVATFDNNSSKTDNFKVKEDGIPPQGELQVIKFYDVNANGVLDPEDTEIVGWQVRIMDGMSIIRSTPVNIIVEADTYTVTECAPDALNWRNTTPTSQTKEVPDGDATTFEFGNVCLGSGGGMTLGFWSNKNGQSFFGNDDLALMVSLNLRNANGTAFDPSNYSQFRNWLLSASATNMAYMLSAQLAAMELNVLNGKVSATSIIYAPGTDSANAFGFAMVGAVMTEANTELGLHGSTVSGSGFRMYQEALKNALDNANNNKTFVQSTPCPTPLTFTCP